MKNPLRRWRQTGNQVAAHIGYIWKGDIYVDKKKIHNLVIPAQGYKETMETVVLPYLAERKTERYCEREKGKKIFYLRCLADHPAGIAVLSHGYTETADKYLENIYYFLRGGYHVFMPEHCGHGRSYRLCSNTRDFSLVHIDDYQRYVEDLLYVSRIAAQEFPELPLCLYGHSMGGGIAACAAAQEPRLYSRLILSSPMIRPNSAPIPWPLACLAAKAFCLTDREEYYLPGNHPYDGTEQYADSASASECRFLFYQEKRGKEPLFQMNAASYGWLWQTHRLNRALQKKAWRRISCPTRIFQADQEAYVSKKEQERFVKKLCRRKNIDAKLIRVKGSKHEIFNSDDQILEAYWKKIL